MSEVRELVTEVRVKDAKRVRQFFGQIWGKTVYVVNANGSQKRFESIYALLDYLEQLGIVKREILENVEIWDYGEINGVKIRIDEKSNVIKVETDASWYEDLKEAQEEHRERVNKVVQELMKFNLLADDVRCRQIVITECSI